MTIKAQELYCFGSLLDLPSTCLQTIGQLIIVISDSHRLLGRKFGMKTRAAVAFKSGAPLEVVDVDLEGPKAGEVLVEIKATGV